MPIYQTRNTKHTSSSHGFTLIELVVVVFLISLMLFLAIPRFGSTLFSDSGRKSMLRMTSTIHGLKEKSVRDQTDYHLHLDLDENQMWISRDGMSDAELDDARTGGHRFEESLTLMAVAAPDNRKATSGEVRLRFNKKGYSSMAVIHVKDQKGQHHSLEIQPFLSTVRLSEGHLEYEP